MPIWKTTAFAALLTTAAIAGAQNPDPFDAHCADILLLQSKPIQTEVGITKAQRDRMNVFADGHRAKMAELKTEYQQKHKDVTSEVADTYRKFKENILSLLTAAQIRRLREITLQGVGLAALRDQVVTDKIGMTKAQADRYNSIYKEGATKFAETEKAAIEPILKPYEGRTPKTKEEAEKLSKEVQAKLLVARKKVEPVLTKLRASYDAKLRAVLTPGQMKAYQALLGKPFRGPVANPPKK